MSTSRDGRGEAAAPRPPRQAIDFLERRNARYRIVEHPAFKKVERSVIGASYGVSSFTTKAQADRMAEACALTPGDRLLDIGSGAGWPGIYIAAKTGAGVVLSDIPVEGHRVARRRLEADGVDGDVVVATGRHLPFRGETFTAVVSSDVFC